MGVAPFPVQSGTRFQGFDTRWIRLRKAYGETRLQMGNASPPLAPKLITVLLITDYFVAL